MFWFKFYIPSNLGLVNICKIIYSDRQRYKGKYYYTKQLQQKVSHIVVDFSKLIGIVKLL